MAGRIAILPVSLGLDNQATRFAMDQEPADQFAGADESVTFEK